MIHLCIKSLFLASEQYVTSKTIFNRFPNKPWFLRVCSTSILKTLREKETLLVTSNVSFSPVFSILLENSLPFSSNLKLSSANALNFEESEMCRLGNG